MTALQWIVKEAKKLKKEYPKRFSSWKEYVAQASAIYAKKHKGKSPVGKKKVGAVKKKAAKKVAKKKVATKKKATTRNYGSHKDTGSHNVKISVTSGMGSIQSHLYNQYGLLAAKKLKQTTKRGKKEIQKKMTETARKLRKIKNFLK